MPIIGFSSVHNYTLWLLTDSPDKGCFRAFGPNRHPAAAPGFFFQDGGITELGDARARQAGTGLCGLPQILQFL
jgi:hypothetical protein